MLIHLIEGWPDEAGIGMAFSDMVLALPFVFSANLASIDAAGQSHNDVILEVTGSRRCPNVKLKSHRTVKTIKENGLLRYGERIECTMFSMLLFLSY